MDLVCFVVSVAIIVLTHMFSRDRVMSFLSPVALVGWYGIVYLTLPAFAIDFGMQTAWSRYVPEPQLMSLATGPFLVFAVAAAGALWINSRFHRDPPVPYRVEPVPNPSVGVALLVVATLSFLFLALTGRMSTSFVGTTSEEVQDIDFKYFLVMIDLAIPGIAVLAFQRDHQWKTVTVVASVALLVFVLLGSRYRVVMLALLVTAIVMLRSKKTLRRAWQALEPQVLRSCCSWASVAPIARDSTFTPRWPRR